MPNKKNADTNAPPLDDSSAIPSSLELDSHATAARSGRRHQREREMEEGRVDEAVTSGDPDADQLSAMTVGDEAPGGDNPTPDQNVVEEAARAAGVDYQDTEELRAVDKIDKRDRRRWELDPASSEDYHER